MELRPDNVQTLLHRFYNFDDAVVARVDMLLRPRPLSCTIDIHAGDREAGGWGAVRLTIENATQFRFDLGKRSFLVLSFGVQFIWRDDKIFVLLDAVPEGGDVLPDLADNKGYVAGTSCSWEYLGPVT